MCKHLAWHAEQRNATVVAAVLTGSSPVLDRDDQSPFPVWRNGSRVPNGNQYSVQPTDQGLPSPFSSGWGMGICAVVRGMLYQGVRGNLVNSKWVGSVTFKQLMQINYSRTRSNIIKIDKLMYYVIWCIGLKLWIMEKLECVHRIADDVTRITKRPK